MFNTLLRAFQEWNPALVEQMKNCSHHYSHKHLNPYHLEDDVWNFINICGGTQNVYL